MPFFTVLLFLVAFQSISDGAPGPKYPVPRLPNDAAWDEVLVEKRAGKYSSAFWSKLRTCLHIKFKVHVRLLFRFHTIFHLCGKSFISIPPAKIQHNACFTH